MSVSTACQATQELLEVRHHLGPVQKAAHVATAGDRDKGGVGNPLATGFDIGVGGIRLTDHEQSWDGQRREDVVESHGLFPLEALGDQGLAVIRQEALPHGG